MTKINIIGDGVFGMFLRGFLNQHPNVKFSKDAEIVILAVPSHAYEEVAKQHEHKLLVNVCSIQESTNMICMKYSDDVLGIHPMFGKKTPIDMLKTCLMTHRATTGKGILLQHNILQVFRHLSVKIIRYNKEGDKITGEWHDRLMAKSHFVSLRIAEFAAPLLKDMGDIDHELLTPTSIRLKQLVDQLQDMPEGTRSSIKANPYGEE